MAKITELLFKQKMIKKIRTIINWNQRLFFVY
jgi:hypothetical protein